jgi:hypothetical protein
MTKGILEGLVKPKINVETDMSAETNSTYNIGTYIDRPVINIDKLVINDKDVTDRIMKMLCPQSVEVQATEEET